MSFALVAGAMVVSGAVGALAAGKAADTQAAAADRASQLQYEQFQQQREDQAPWRKAGEQALNQLIPLATNYTPFGMQQFQADPGYQFRLQEGLKQLQGRAAARGGALSGATLKGVQQYGQGLASEEYQNAFNRYQTERAARLSPLQSLAGVGQTAVNQLGQAGQAYATGAGEAAQAGAAARASGYVGGANALTGALGQLGQYGMYKQMGLFGSPGAGNYGANSMQAQLGWQNAGMTPSGTPSTSGFYEVNF